MIHFCITGGSPDRVQTLFRNVMHSIPKLQPYIDDPFLQIPLGINRHPPSDSPLIHGPNTDFRALVQRRFSTHIDAWGSHPDLLILDAEFYPKGSWLKMEYPTPTPTIALIARRMGIIREEAYAQPPLWHGIWSPAKHLGYGIVSATQIANAEVLLDATQSTAIIINAYPRQPGAHHTKIIENLWDIWTNANRNFRYLIPAIKLSIGDDPLPFDDAYCLMRAIRRTFDCCIIWMQADTDAHVSQWTTLIQPLGEALTEGWLDVTAEHH